MRAILVVLSAFLMLGCESRSQSNSSPDLEQRKSTPDVRSPHPHTVAMLQMRQAMEVMGYRPLSETAPKSFYKNPFPWLGPQHIASPTSVPYPIEWRLTIYDRHSEEQLHSLVRLDG